MDIAVQGRRHRTLDERVEASSARRLGDGESMKQVDRMAQNGKPNLEVRGQGAKKDDGFDRCKSERLSRR